MGFHSSATPLALLRVQVPGFCSCRSRHPQGLYTHDLVSRPAGIQSRDGGPCQRNCSNRPPVRHHIFIPEHPQESTHRWVQARAAIVVASPFLTSKPLLDSDYIASGDVLGALQDAIKRSHQENDDDTVRTRANAMHAYCDFILCAFYPVVLGCTSLIRAPLDSPSNANSTPISCSPGFMIFSLL